MLSEFSEVFCEDALKEIWRALRRLTSTSYTQRLIMEVHQSSQQHMGNIRKQARQIAYSVRQAEEYFRASRHVGLLTRPLLLYYGAASLAWASILLYKTGDYSLDAIRDKHKQHKHHGLDIIGEPRKGQGAIDFLRSLCCSTHFSAACPAGTFPLFYNTLQRRTICVQANLYWGQPISRVGNVSVWSAGNGETVPFGTRPMLLPSGEVPPLNPDAPHALRAWDAITLMPDMYEYVVGLRDKPRLAKGLLSASIHLGSATGTAGESTAPDHLVHLSFALSDLTPDDKGALMRAYPEGDPHITIWDTPDTDFVLGAEYRSSESWTIVAPDVLEDIFHRHYFVLPGGPAMPEPASHFAVLYMLGMVARYYPDIWAGSLDSNTELAEILGALLDVVERKYPQMLLDQLTGTLHYFRQ